MPTASVWCGETTCNICHDACGLVLYDGKTVIGPWAVMCHRCFPFLGLGIGQGRGQKYLRQDDGTYVKIEG